MKKDIGYLQLRYYKRQSRAILKKSKLKQVKSRKELVELIKKYYNNITDLKSEKILLQNEIDEIRESKMFSQLVGIITIIITVMIFVLSNVNAQNNNFKADSENRVNILESRKEDYWMRVLELDNKIKYSKDDREKEQLLDLRLSLSKEIDIENKSIEIELENNKNLDFFSFTNGIKYLFWFVSFFYFCVCREALINNKRSNKKEFLNLKLSIVNQIIEERPYKYYVGHNKENYF